jgi:hypothetical protein
MKILKLTLKKKWFDMIESRIKLEEYREIKPYWTVRFENNDYDEVEFTNGYRSYSPRCQFKLIRICIGIGKPEWGAPPDREVYKLILGEVVSKN